MVIVLVVVALILLLRKFLRDKSKEANEDWSTVKPGTENASAFIAASMQGVIEKLRAQEKEPRTVAPDCSGTRTGIGAAHRGSATRNMPTGLLLVNATGAIGSSNPAAEDALGLKSLRYRSYKRGLRRRDSGLAHMLEACLREGKDLPSRRSGTHYQRRRGPTSGRHNISNLPWRSECRRSLEGEFVIFTFRRRGRDTSERRAVPNERSYGS